MSQWELVFEGCQDRLDTLCHSLTKEFPPPDLADSLIDLFFLHVNSQCPLFHRPTFVRQWREGLQEKDPWFGCLCLSLFAVASRWSDDPRVLDGDEYEVLEAEVLDEECKWQRAGWKYFNVAVGMPAHIVGPSFLVDLTVFCRCSPRFSQLVSPSWPL